MKLPNITKLRIQAGKLRRRSPIRSINRFLQRCAKYAAAAGGPAVHDRWVCYHNKKNRDGIIAALSSDKERDEWSLCDTATSTAVKKAVGGSEAGTLIMFASAMSTGLEAPDVWHATVLWSAFPPGDTKRHRPVARILFDPRHAVQAEDHSTSSNVWPAGTTVPRRILQQRTTGKTVWLIGEDSGSALDCVPRCARFMVDVLERSIETGDTAAELMAQRVQLHASPILGTQHSCI